MFKLIKIIALPLLLAAIVGVLSLAGCGEKATGPEGTEAAGELTQQEMQQILTDSVLAMKTATSYEFSLVLNMDIEATGGDEAGTMETTIKASGVADIADNEMQMSFEMSLDNNSFGIEEGSQDISADMYMLTDWIYMKMDITGMGEQWVKMPLTEELKEAYNLNMVDQQITPLESPAATIEFVKYETFDGSECYVFKIVPDMESMRQWLDEQQIISGTVDPDAVLNLEDVFKELAYITWIAKDSKLMKKMNVAMLIEMNAEQAGAPDSGLEKMIVNMHADMTLENYNEPVSIVLPEEAEDAMEV
jgi:hypothetical protein